MKKPARTRALLTGVLMVALLSLIVVVGTHHTLEEFLDKGRPGMSSTFITHLRVGGKLVNARGVQVAANLAELSSAVTSTDSS